MFMCRLMVVQRNSSSQTRRPYLARSGGKGGRSMRERAGKEFWGVAAEEVPKRGRLGKDPKRYLSSSAKSMDLKMGDPAAAGWLLVYMQAVIAMQIP